MNYNMNNNISKKSVENAKRIEKQTAEYLQEYDNKLRTEAADKEAKLLEAAMSGARFTQASGVARSKQRVNALKEEIEYTNTSSITAMTEMVAKVVEKGLLLDEEEFAQLNPNYKEEIRETVRGLLENADTNLSYDNANTNVLVDYVAKTLPNVKDGKYLTEEEMTQIINTKMNKEVEDAIANLSGSVASRVALLVEKEQKKIEKINKKLKKAGASDESEVIDEVPVPDENAEEKELENQPEEAPVEEPVAEEVPEDAALADEEAAEAQAGELPAEPGVDGVPEEVPAEGEAPIAGATPKKQIQMLPDGTMNINVFENTLVRETPRCGLFESLTVNEALHMVEEGKEYNADLAMANAIMYMTVVEAMGETGLMTVNENVYADIISKCGGNIAKSEISKAPLKENTNIFAVDTNVSDDFAERIRQKKLLKEAKEDQVPPFTK